MKEEINQHLKELRDASRRLVGLKDEEIRRILNEVADLALSKESEILAANKLDLGRMDPDNPKYDRLLLNPDRLKAIADDMRRVEELQSPIGQVIEEIIRPNGLKISQVSVPIGVIGIVFESRPNVTFDVFSLCLKSGNACVLKGSRDAHDSNTIIVSIIREILAKYDFQEAVYLAPSEREALPHILEADEYIDCVIPRGSQGLIDFVRSNARVPVIETGAGIVHTYVDESADLEKAKKITQNAKTRRVSVCNALDCLVVHEKLVNKLPMLLEGMDSGHSVKVYADESSYEALKGAYDSNLLYHAREEDYGIEWLAYKMSIKTVKDMDHALEHINKYSSKHSESIVSENQERIDRFLQYVDAACVYANASTAFSDGGEFGLGAEIGISTQKLHARGPMGLKALTSYKWIVAGSGQIRP